MTRTQRQAFLLTLIGLMTATSILFFSNLSIIRDTKPPSEPLLMAAWLVRHPADAATANAMAETALDSLAPGRIELWRASYALAERLAPNRLNTAIAFVRGGLFHWPELGAADRKTVLQAAEELLHDEQNFASLYEPLFRLTGDFAYLRRNAPVTIASLERLRALAVTNGLFEEYRELRETLRAERWKAFQAARKRGEVATLFELLPPRLEAKDDVFVRGILEELDRSAYDLRTGGAQLDDLILYAIRHRMEPLAALSPVSTIPGIVADATRARLALALGNTDAASKIELSSSTTRSPEWARYHLERAHFEANHGQARLAEVHLARASQWGMTPDVMVMARDVTLALGNEELAARYGSELQSLTQAPPRWEGTCSENELCDRAVARRFVPEDRAPIRVHAEAIQTDETPPYVEIYVDDTLAAEGAVTEDRDFRILATSGVHRVEVRLVNRFTRNGVQRRVRLS